MVNFIIYLRFLNNSCDSTNYFKVFLDPNDKNYKLYCHITDPIIAGRFGYAFYDYKIQNLELELDYCFCSSKLCHLTIQNFYILLFKLYNTLKIKNYDDIKSIINDNENNDEFIDYLMNNNDNNELSFEKSFNEITNILIMINILFSNKKNNYYFFTKINDDDDEDIINNEKSLNLSKLSNEEKNNEITVSDAKKKIINNEIIFIYNAIKKYKLNLHKKFYDLFKYIFKINNINDYAKKKIDEHFN
jgi:hypothetical protein